MLRIEPSLNIKNNEIHVWEYNIVPDTYLAEKLLNSLSVQEKSKIKNIKISEVKHRSIISKFITKSIISKYLGKYIDEVVFDYNKFGKPSLSADINSINLKFNISHSGDIGILAISREKLIGIDVEQLNYLDDIEDIINNYFSDYEISLLNDSKNSNRIELFYKIWTGKEAFIKAIGQGLTFPLKNISFGFDSQSGIILKYIEEYPASSTEWKIYNFVPQENYTSTLAVNMESFILKRFKWNQTEKIL
jgi:4'-phosphopantetheinyl transferase